MPTQKSGLSSGGIGVQAKRVRRLLGYLTSWERLKRFSQLQDIDGDECQAPDQRISQPLRSANGWRRFHHDWQDSCDAIDIETGWRGSMRGQRIRRLQFETQFSRFSSIWWCIVSPLSNQRAFRILTDIAYCFIEEFSALSALQQLKRISPLSIHAKQRQPHLQPFLKMSQLQRSEEWCRCHSKKTTINIFLTKISCNQSILQQKVQYWQLCLRGSRSRSNLATALKMQMQVTTKNSSSAEKDFYEIIRVMHT